MSPRSESRCGSVAIAVAAAPRSRRTAPVKDRWSAHASSLLATAGRSEVYEPCSDAWPERARFLATIVVDDSSKTGARYVGRSSRGRPKADDRSCLSAHRVSHRVSSIASARRSAAATDSSQVTPGVATSARIVSRRALCVSTSVSSARNDDFACASAWSIASSSARTAVAPAPSSKRAPAEQDCVSSPAAGATSTSTVTSAARTLRMVVVVTAPPRVSRILANRRHRTPRAEASRRSRWPEKHREARAAAQRPRAPPRRV